VALGAGVLLPLLLIVWTVANGGGLRVLVWLSSLLILLGGFIFRYCILKAGVYPPLF